MRNLGYSEYVVWGWHGLTLLSASCCSFFLRKSSSIDKGSRRLVPFASFNPFAPFPATADGSGRIFVGLFLDLRRELVQGRYSCHAQ